MCREYLLPSELVEFRQTSKLPAIHQKCLLCSRYYQNYLYMLARNDPTFRAAANVCTQRFANVVGGDPALPDHSVVVATAGTLPKNASKVACTDGYSPSAMLFVDEGYATCSASRDSKMAALQFKPVVRFSCDHYVYKVDESGAPYIVQSGIGMDDGLDGLGFQGGVSDFRAPLSPARAGAADGNEPRKGSGQ